MYFYVDNCSSELHRKLANQLKGTNCPVGLLTIEYDLQDDEPENTDVFHLEAMSSEIIERILARKYPNLNDPDIRTIASFSDGNARVAIALGATAQEGESLANLNDADLFRRLFRQRNEDNPALLRAAIVCSLLYSFDIETLEGDDAEFPILAALAEQSVVDLHGNIAELHRRQLVQDRSKWRAVLPHALAHKLAKQALQDIPLAYLKTKLIDQATVRMLRSFSRRIGFLHDLPEAQALVASLMSDDNWLANVCLLNELGMVMLNNMAPVNPDAVLDSLETSINKSIADSTDILNKQELATLLRSLAYAPEKFARSCRLIITLACPKDAENNMSEPHAAFASLFYLYLSGTHAGPKTRADVLRELLASDNQFHWGLFEKGLSNMLTVSHFTSSHGFEFGAHKRDFGYRPKTSDDVKAWYQCALNLCTEVVESNHAISDNIKSMIARKFRWLVEHTGMVDEAIEMAERIHVHSGWPQGWVGVRGAIKEAKKAKANEAVEKLEKLDRLLQPNSLTDLIQSYVIPEQWSRLDLADVDFDDDDRHRKAEEHINGVCVDIAQRLIAEPSEFEAVFPQLVGTRSQRVWTVAENVGRLCDDARALWNILLPLYIDHKDRKSCAFPAAFLKGVAENDQELADDLLEDVIKNVELHTEFIQIAVNKGLTDRSYDLVLTAFDLETVPTHSFSNLGYNREETIITVERMKAIIDALSLRESGFTVAFQIFYQRFVMWAKRENTALKPEAQLLGKSLLQNFEFERDNRRGDFEIRQVAAACLTESSDEGIARVMLRRFANAINNYNAHGWDFPELLGLIGERYPEALLDELVEGNPEGDTVRGLWSDIRDNRPCPTEKMETTRVISWMEHKAATRFAEFSQAAVLWKKQDSESDFEWTPIANYIITNAPNTQTTLDIILRRMHPMSWSGSRAHVLSLKLPLLEQLRSHENPDVVAWARNNIPAYSRNIEAERNREAKRSRERDEKFDW